VSPKWREISLSMLEKLINGMTKRNKTYKVIIKAKEGFSEKKL